MIAKTKDEPKKSSFRDFASNPYYIIITLLLTVIGGVPGVIKIVEFLGDKPEFEFTYSNALFGQTVNEPGVAVFLSGTISNIGKKPILIAKFGLIIECDGKQYIMSPAYIPKDIILDTSKFKLDLNNPSEHDLLNVQKLDVNEAISGTFLFKSRQITRQELYDAGKKHMKIKCFGINGDTYTSEFDTYTGSASSLPTIDPRTKIKYFPKDSTSIPLHQ